MGNSRDAEDECSYISRLPERDSDAEFGCFLRLVGAVLLIVLVLMLGKGC